MSQSIVEIRDYTFEAQWFEAYKKWALELATPWLKANMDIVCADINYIYYICRVYGTHNYHTFLIIVHIYFKNSYFG